MSHLFGNLATLNTGVPRKDGVIGNSTDGNRSSILDVDLDWATGMAEAAKRYVS